MQTRNAHYYNNNNQRVIYWIFYLFTYRIMNRGNSIQRYKHCNIPSSFMFKPITDCGYIKYSFRNSSASHYSKNISYVCNDKIRNQNTFISSYIPALYPPTNLLDYQYFLMNTKGPSRSREGKYPLLRRQARRATPSTLASQHHCQQNDQISLKAWQSPLVGYGIY